MADNTKQGPKDITDLKARLGLKKQGGGVPAPGPAGAPSAPFAPAPIAGPAGVAAPRPSAGGRELAVPDFDDGKLSRHKEGVEQYDDQHDYSLPEDFTSGETPLAYEFGRGIGEQRSHEAARSGVHSFS